MIKINRLAGNLRRVNWIGVTILLFVCIPFLLIGLSEVFKAARLTREMESAQGTVVDNVWQAFAEGGASYVPVVEFRTIDGQLVRFNDGIGTYPAEYEIGAEVSVLYNPQDPQDARLNTWKRIWFAPLLLISIGLLPLLVGLGLAWLLQPKGRPNQNS